MLLMLLMAHLKSLKTNLRKLALLVLARGGLGFVFTKVEK